MDVASDLTIDIIDNAYFSIRGNLKLLTDNPRALISLNRINYKPVEDGIIVGFTPETKINTLNSIKEIATKFNYSYALLPAVKETLGTYQSEMENFSTFSGKADSIRNDKFNTIPELVDDFRNFKDILSKTMTRKLYDLQMLSAFHMAFSQNACNFAVPGAGKTSIVYGAYTYLKSLPESDPKHIDKILVVGPLSSFAPWEKEYFKCFGVKADCQRLSGDVAISKDEKERHLYSTSPKELTLMSHAGMQFLKPQVIDFLKQNKVLVVIDEAHKIKNVDGIWGKSAIEMAKEATGRVILTGTPAPNGYEDLYNLIQFIYPFQYKNILKIHYGQLKELSKMEADNDNPRVSAFIDNIEPFFIRIKKTDLNLPPVNEQKVWVKMDSLQRDIYDFIEEKYIPYFANKSSATVKDALNRARLIRLRQAATNPKLLIKPLRGSLESSTEGADPNSQFADNYDDSVDDSEIFQNIKKYSKTVIPAKFIATRDIYNKDILPVKGKVIVWTIFIQNAEELQEYLNNEGIKSRLLIGRIPQEEREDVIDKFNDPNNDDFNVVIANPFSVSESISLHEGCHNAIYMERDYNAANFLQSKDRIHRVGLQEGTITNYYYLVSPDSVDEVVNTSLSTKVKRMEEIINEDIPLFQRIHDNDETDIITNLLRDYARRT